MPDSLASLSDQDLPHGPLPRCRHPPDEEIRVVVIHHPWTEVLPRYLPLVRLLHRRVANLTTGSSPR
jgi:hypothetical protein